MCDGGGGGGVCVCVGGGSKAFSKSCINVSTLPLLSKIDNSLGISPVSID